MNLVRIQLIKCKTILVLELENKTTGKPLYKLYVLL